MAAAAATLTATAYLDERGRCQLHGAAGPHAKPLGCRTFPAHFVDDGANNLVDAVDTAAPGRDRNPLPWPEPIADAGPAELVGDCGSDVVDLCCVEKLAHWCPVR